MSTFWLLRMSSKFVVIRPSGGSKERDLSGSLTRIPSSETGPPTRPSMRIREKRCLCLCCGRPCHAHQRGERTGYGTSSHELPEHWDLLVVGYRCYGRPIGVCTNPRRLPGGGGRYVPLPDCANRIPANALENSSPTRVLRQYVNERGSAPSHVGIPNLTSLTRSFTLAR